MRSTLFILFTFLLISCSSDPETYTVEIIDGVRHVHNIAPLWGDEPKIELEFVRKIGELEGDDENYLLYKPRDIVVDDGGNMYILDAGAYRIMKYDSKGRFLLSFGRQGQGPGELESAWGLEIDNNNRLYITGNYSKIVNVFDVDGNFIQRILGDFRASYIHKLHNGNFISYFSVVDPKDYETAFLIHVFDPEGKIMKEFGTRRKYEEMNMKWMGNTISIANDQKDNIYTAYLYQNRIVKYNPEGEKQLVISRELPYPESEKYEMKRYQKDGETKHYRKVNYVSLEIGIDSNERIWIPRQKRELTETELKNGGIAEDNNMIFEYYSMDGILLGHSEFQLPKRVFRTRIFKDRIFLIDCYNEMAVYEYRIVER